MESSIINSRESVGACVRKTGGSEVLRMRSDSGESSGTTSENVNLQQRERGISVLKTGTREQRTA